MMKLKKFLKRIAAFSLAVVLTVAALPSNVVVHAGPDDYPPEIMFPINVLDFRADNLLFEYNRGYQATSSNNGINLDLYTGSENNGGKGLVEDELGPDGVPVYKRETVERIAKYVQRRLKVNGNGNIIDVINYNNEPNYLSVRNYIMREGYAKLEAEDGTLQGAQRVDVNNFSNQAGVKVTTGNKVSFTYNATTTANHTITLYYASGTRNKKYKVQDDNEGATNTGNTSNNGDPLQVTTRLEAGENVITIWGNSNDVPNLDYIVIQNPNGDYPLGNYDESKKKYTEDMDPELDGVQNTRGWTDMKTCMDYAYFVTSNLFKYNSTLNSQLEDYNQLSFHKVEDAVTGKAAYEFIADNRHPNDKLIFNKNTHTVRNVYGDDQGNTANGDEIRNGGSLFIADDAEKDFALDTDYNISGQMHNFHYTLRSNSYFVYKESAGQYFYFSGDDDVYVFVNGKLLVDLGGAHSQINGDFDLDELAEVDNDGDGKNDYGLVDGEVVSLSLFYMERHTTASNFYAKLNFKLASDSLKHVFDYATIPYGHMANLTYSFTAQRELNTDKKFTFTDNFGNVIGADGFVLGDGVSLLDNKLVVTVKKPDGTVDEERSRTFEFENPNNPTSANDVATIAALKEYFTNIGIERFETLEISGAQFDTATRDYDDDTFYTNVEDEHGVNSKMVVFEPQVSYDAWMNGATSPTSNTLTASNPVKVIVGSITIATAPDEDTDGDGFIDEVNLKKELADYGDFVFTRTDTKGVTRINYTNNTAYGVSEVTLDKLSLGDYTLTVDETVLTGYTVIVNGKSIVSAIDPVTNNEVKDTTKYSTMNKETGINAKMLTIPFHPVYDPETKEWSYPEVRFELKATRDLPALKDLT